MKTDVIIERLDLNRCSKSVREFLWRTLRGRPADFTHRDHLYLAWLLLQRLPLEEAIDLLRSTLKRLAESHGAFEKYNETITVAFAFAIKQRLQNAPQEVSWSEFINQHGELNEGVAFMKRYYRWETAVAAAARKEFVEPDLSYPPTWQRFAQQVRKAGKNADE